MQRGRHERRHRRVGLRPAPDTMAVLTGYLPVEQGVACLAALRAHTDGLVATGQDERSRDQIMADTFVERLTGQARAQDVAVEVQIVVPLAALCDPDGGVAILTGAGPLPSALVEEPVDASAGAKRWRGLLASPAGRLVGIGRRRRRFTGAVADLVLARDQTCREAACGAPVRHLDHVRRWAAGGETSVVNGRGLCARHNLVREQPGWSAVVVHDGLGTQPHTVQTTTPTGHAYTARAPDPP